MKTATRLDFVALPKDYTGLSQMLTPRPLHDKVDFENVSEITDAMAGHKLTADQEDYFDLFCRLIEDYDKEHLDAPKVLIFSLAMFIFMYKFIPLYIATWLKGIYPALGARI